MEKAKPARFGVMTGTPEHGPEYDAPEGNTHPTVKPLAVCRWLVCLITPPGGLVLDPFAGSGSTGVAAVQEGFSFLGIEQSSDYCRIARRRIRASGQEKRQTP
jgi:site-specific DNA-methyltransferase (adenine-specific)